MADNLTPPETTYYDTIYRVCLVHKKPWMIVGVWAAMVSSQRNAASSASVG